MDRQDMLNLAEKVATKLYNDCTSGTISKIGIEEVRAELNRHPGPKGQEDRVRLEEMTLRRLLTKGL
jgi:hypothetical protein